MSLLSGQSIWRLNAYENIALCILLQKKKNKEKTVQSGEKKRLPEKNALRAALQISFTVHSRQNDTESVTDSSMGKKT